jgi:AraC family transcriptional regulator, ethanolamine operon transcriptional activator
MTVGNYKNFKLVQYPIEDIEDLRSPVWGVNFDVTQLRPGDVKGRITHAILGEFALSFSHLKCPASLRARGEIPGEAMRLAFTLGAERPARVWGTETALGNGTMLSASGGEYDAAHSGGKSFGHAAITLPASIGLSLAGMLNPALVPLLSSPAIWRPTREQREILRDCICSAMRTLRNYKNNLDPNFDEQAFARTIAAAFLTAMEPDAACRLALPPDVYVVRQAEELLRHEENPIVSVSDLCLRLGVGRRSLERAFRHFLDLSPLKYLMAYRLCRAHNELAAGNGTVTGIAMRYGFYELGRFSERYRRLFGELPSETLASKELRAARRQLSLGAMSDLAKRLE